MFVREGADPRTSGMFYISLVKSVLLFGSQTWAVTYHILRAGGDIHNLVARRIYGRMHKCIRNGGWDNPPIGEALVDVGLETIVVDVSYRYNTVSQYIYTRTIFEILVAKQQRPVSPALLWQWDQEGVRFRGGGEAEAEGGDMYLGQ